MFTSGQFPTVRHRRLRQSQWIRDLVQESRLTLQDLILPVFIRTSESSPTIISLPGVQRYTLEELPTLVNDISKLGILAVALFPVTPFDLKTAKGCEALNLGNLICQAIRSIKTLNPELGIITDVALDPYTSHGHDGLIRNNQIDNDQTIQVLCQQALNQAQAGSDAIAPSDMMDGRIGAIRQFLDQHGYQQTILISYAVKYASIFYGPFRQALGLSTLQGLKDKKTYQLNPANSEEALREVALDLQEGADMIIVKPGLPYLDIVHRVAHTFKAPTLAYQVSGEYAAIMAAGQNGWLDTDQAMLESLLAFKRAGACGILTYSALRIAPYLQ
jgi:porphobilinogen synthase